VVVVRDVAGARFVSRDHPPIMERMRLESSTRSRGHHFLGNAAQTMSRRPGRSCGGASPPLLALPPLGICAAILLAGCGGSSTPSAAPAAGVNFAGPAKIGGSRKLFLKCRGTGAPTVVLISGFRGGYDDWTHVVADPGAVPRPSRSSVLPRVGRFTRVCAYDRPGTVSFDETPTASTPVPQPTTAQGGAADLHALLSAAEVPGPYVLVAHSWGA